MRKISKTDTRSYRTTYRWGALLLGVPFVGIGLPFALIGFGVWDVELDANAPMWVLGAVGAAFTLAGGLVIVHGVRGVLNRRRIERTRLLHDEAWFLDHPWDPEGVEDHPGGRVGHGLVGILLFGVFLAPFHWWAFLSGQGPFMVKAIVILFDLVLFLIVGTTVYHLLQLVKYGRSRLRFARFPFHPGGELRAVFLPARFPRARFTLRFVEERFEERGSGEDRRSVLVCYEHYRETKKVEPARLETEVPVEFDLPDREEWVTELSGQPVRYWELLVEAEVPGVDFKTTFPLPVYADPRGTAKATAPSGGSVSRSE